MPSFRLTVQRKVFLAILALTGSTVALLFASTQWHLAQGFGRYAAETELLRLDGLVDELAAGYRRQGNWGFLRGDARPWPRRVHDSLRPAGERPPALGEPRPPRPAGFPGGPPPRPFADGRPPPPPEDDLFTLAQRLRLIDSQGRLLAGDERSAASERPSVERAILVDGQRVGRLLLQVPQTPASTQAVAFLASQSSALWLASASALLLACLAAWWLARHFLAPIHQLAAASRRIAGGDYAIRIPVQHGDELGDLADDFNAMADILARAETSRRQWIADTSHELRTPLAVLRAEIEALQDGVRSPGDASYARLHKQIMQLGKLVDDLRYSLEAAPDGPALDRQPVAPLALLEDSVEQFRARFVAARLSLDGSALPGDGPLLWADADRLRQIFANLLENSLRYTNPGGRLQLRAGTADGQLWIAFDDSAPAPPPATLPRLFDRFFRAEPSRSRAHGGSGLGLAICKTLVEAHGGRIAATLSPLGGLRIHLTLPLEH